VQVGFAVMTASAPSEGVLVAESLHVDPKLFDPKMRSSMTRVTIALTQNIFAAWDTQTLRLRLLWDVADIQVLDSDPRDGADDLALVVMKTDSRVKLSLLPLTHQFHPLSNWQGEGSASSSAQWRSRFNMVLNRHSFIRTFRPPSWPFRHVPQSIELPPISCGASVVVAVAPNIVWLMAEPATIVVVHLLLQKEIGRVKVPIERPHCVAVGDGMVVCWTLPGGGLGAEPSEGPMLQIFRASDCSLMIQKYVPIPAVRLCCVSSGFIWAVTTNGLIIVISCTGDVVQEFDFNLYHGAGALSVCSCPSGAPATSSPEMSQSSVIVSSHTGYFLFCFVSFVQRGRQIATMMICICEYN
jgi:hypothetical protein